MIRGATHMWSLHRTVTVLSDVLSCCEVFCLFVLCVVVTFLEMYRPTFLLREMCGEMFNPPLP